MVDSELRSVRIVLLGEKHFDVRFDLGVVHDTTDVAAIRPGLSMK
jgi:hypothetical protein